MGIIKIDLDQETIETLAGIKIVEILKEYSPNIEDNIKPEYEPEFGKLGPVWWDDEDEARMDIIGQNGNNGEHYKSQLRKDNYVPNWDKDFT